MDGLNDDSLIQIFLHLDFIEKVRLETVCHRWLHILRSHAVHAKMQSLNLVDYIRENRLHEVADEKNASALLEQTVGAVVERAGPHIHQFDFAHRWPIISEGIVRKITENCPHLTKLDMGWVRFEADISPLLEKCADQLVELSLEESTWANFENANTIPTYLARMRNLRRLNLRKFPLPLEELAKLEGSQLQFLDVSEAAQLHAPVLIDFLERNPQILCLHLCPMPYKCLPLVAGSTTSAINRAGPFIGFISGSQQKMVSKQTAQQNANGGQRQEGEKRRPPKKGADLQALIDRLGKMPQLRTLWLGHITYSAHFLQFAPIGDLQELRHLHLKECNALDGTALKAILSGTREHLRQLSLLNCPYLDDFSSLSVCAFLTQLDVEGAKALRDEAIQALAHHGRLKIVRFNGCPQIGQNAIWALAQKCPLKELELVKCEGIGAELFANGQAFATCDKLERISLSGTEAITNKSIGQAMESLSLDMLQQLDLSRNMNLDDTALGMIKEALEKAKGKRTRGKTLIVYCSSTGISREMPLDRYEPLIELAFY